LKKDIDSFQVIPEIHRSFELCIAAVKLDGYVLRCIPDQLQSFEVCLAAVKQHDWALRFVKNQNYEICMAALKQHHHNVNSYIHCPCKKSFYYYNEVIYYKVDNNNNYIRKQIKDKNYHSPIEFVKDRELRYLLKEIEDKKLYDDPDIHDRCALINKLCTYFSFYFLSVYRAFGINVLPTPVIASNIGIYIFIMILYFSLIHFAIILLYLNLYL
jgi:hypothetical protein